jgi:hypothetical protein
MAETPVKARVGRPKKLLVLGGTAVEVARKGGGVGARRRRRGEMRRRLARGGRRRRRIDMRRVSFPVTAFSSAPPVRLYYPRTGKTSKRRSIGAIDGSCPKRKLEALSN